MQISRDFIYVIISPDYGPIYYSSQAINIVQLSVLARLGIMP